MPWRPNQFFFDRWNSSNSLKTLSPICNKFFIFFQLENSLSNPTWISFLFFFFLTNDKMAGQTKKNLVGSNWEIWISTDAKLFWKFCLLSWTKFRWVINSKRVTFPLLQKGYSAALQNTFAQFSEFLVSTCRIRILWMTALESWNPGEAQLHDEIEILVCQFPDLEW